MCVGFNPQRQAVKSLGWKNTATRFPLYVGYYHASDGIPGAWNVGTHGASMMEVCMIRYIAGDGIANPKV
jgi:hypothetical protein